MRIVHRSLGSALVIFVVACGGSKQEPQEPESSGAESAESSEPESEEGSTEGEGDEAAKEEKSDDSAASEEKKEEAPTRSAKDIVTKPDVLYMLSLTASEPYQKAEKKCEEKSGDDPKKKADCVAKVSKGFDPDGIAFKQEEGKWWWLTIRRKGSGLVTLHKIEVEFADDSEKKVTIKTKGRDKGTKPMGNVPQEVVIEVPSESEIAIVDSKQGRLVYEAKLGLLGEDAREKGSSE